MINFRKHIGYLLLILFSVFVLPEQLWHSHDHTVEVSHNECDHEAHLQDNGWECTLCQLNTSHFYLDVKQATVKVSTLFKGGFIANSVYSTKRLAKLPFLRGPPLSS